MEVTSLRPQDEPRILTYPDVKSRIEQIRAGVHLIDVREPHELVHGCIPTAVNIPLSVLVGSLHLDPTTFKLQVGHDKPAAHEEVVFYCRSGNRSTRACRAALDYGYSNILNYKGSWLDWVQQESVYEDSLQRPNP